MAETPFKSDHFEVHVVGPEAADHTVPVDVLVRTLRGLQQTNLLLEASRETKPVNSRFSPSEEVRRRSELRCGPVRDGCVAVDIQAEVRSDQSDELSRPVARLVQVIRAVASSDFRSLDRLVPDSRYRERVLRETRSYLPKAGQRWSLELRQGELQPISLNLLTRAQIDKWFAADVGEAPTILTGRLVNIDFKRNQVWVDYPVTKQTLKFNYEVDAEDSLFQARREWVQVRGSFKLDKHGEVTGVKNAQQVEPLDLSPLTLDAVSEGALSLVVIGKPLELAISLDEETEQLLTVDDPELNLRVAADTRDELVAEVHIHLAFLWREYALEEPAKLSPAAQRLRLRLLARLRATS